MGGQFDTRPFPSIYDIKLFESVVILSKIMEHHDDNDTLIDNDGLSFSTTVNCFQNISENADHPQARHYNDT